MAKKKKKLRDPYASVSVSRQSAEQLFVSDIVTPGKYSGGCNFGWGTWGVLFDLAGISFGDGSNVLFNSFTGRTLSLYDAVTRELLIDTAFMPTVLNVHAIRLHAEEANVQLDVRVTSDAIKQRIHNKGLADAFRPDKKS